MANTSKDERLKTRDVAYYRRRQQNRIFTALAEMFAKEAESGGITKKILAERLGRDPSQITRWLSAPSNFELDTLSDILLAMGAELDVQPVRFCDRARANYAHPLLEPYLGWQTVQAGSSTAWPLSTSVAGEKIKRRPAAATSENVNASAVEVLTG